MIALALALSTFAGAAGFDGLWDSNLGRLRLTSSSAAVHGIYSFGAGELDGKLEGNSLRFRYADGDKGEGEFALGADGRSLTGRWRAEGEKEWKPWNATRVEAVPGRKWLYVIESRWEENLAEKEYSYGEVLRQFFKPLPNVEVRTREFADKKTLLRWLREAAFLAEPVIVYVSGHGTVEGVESDDGPVGAEPIAQALAPAPSVTLLHFGSCEIMKGKAAEEIQAKGGRFPVSGFTEEVDWSGSALTDLGYLDLMLEHGLDPAKAAAQTALLLPFSSKDVAGSPFGRIGLRFLPAPKRN